MSGPLPLPELLDEWYRWAEWISSNDPDEANGEDLTGWFEFNWVVEDDPGLAWTAILEAIDQPAFIDRVEQCARTNKRFESVLGGVWQSTMPESIWQRVQAVSKLGGQLQ